MNTRPKNEWYDSTPFVPDLRVFEDDNTPTETGLLDASGDKIFRQPKRLKIGFDLERK